MRDRTNGPEATIDKADVDPAPAPGMSSEFRNFLADMEDLIRAATADESGHFARSRERINEGVTEVKASVEALGAAVDERARKTVADTNDFVHESPWKAIGIGAAAGVLLGVLLARRG